MKIFACAMIVLSSAAAFAMPTVGDDAIFNVTQTQGTTTLTGTVEQQLTQANSSGQYLEKVTATVKGQQPQVQQNWVDGTGLVTDQTVTQILSGCAANGGTLQTVTVPAGTFQACGVTNNDGTTTTTFMVAAGVPFGVVAEDIMTTDGQHTVAQLASFHLGQ